MAAIGYAIACVLALTVSGITFTLGINNFLRNPNGRSSLFLAVSSMMSTVVCGIVIGPVLAEMLYSTGLYGPDEHFRIIKSGGLLSATLIGIGAFIGHRYEKVFARLIPWRK